ncbi:MAG: hypothetical protein EON59_09665 [Alphaproteobacteria bacterium]|nr:MAG: hypothetical protein EON59_09665 [Alphaproteobacteria bacterium]
MISALLFVAQLAFLVGLFLVGRRLVRSRKSPGSAGPIIIDASGVATIPVFATFTGLRGLSPWLALSTNSLNPRLVIARDGLQYRVIGERTAPYSLVQSVEVRRGPGTVNLCFVFNDGPFTFSANVGNDASALKALGRLPQSIGRGPEARKLEQQPHR